MFEETYKKACELKNQIEKISNTISILEAADNYKLEPMTRMSSIHVKCGSNGTLHNLSEGEAVCIKRALESEKKRLEFEFGKL